MLSGNIIIILYIIGPYDFEVSVPRTHVSCSVFLEDIPEIRIIFACIGTVHIIICPCLIRILHKGISCDECVVEYLVEPVESGLLVRSFRHLDFITTRNRSCCQMAPWRLLILTQFILAVITGITHGSGPNAHKLIVIRYLKPCAPHVTASVGCVLVYELYDPAIALIVKHRIRNSVTHISVPAVIFIVRLCQNNKMSFGIKIGITVRVLLFGSALIYIFKAVQFRTGKLMSEILRLVILMGSHKSITLCITFEPIYHLGTESHVIVKDKNISFHSVCAVFSGNGNGPCIPRTFLLTSEHIA